MKLKSVPANAVTGTRFTKLSSVAALAFTLAFAAPGLDANGRLGHLANLLGASAAEAHLPAVDITNIAEASVQSVVNVFSTKIEKPRAGGAPHGEDIPEIFNDPMFRRFFEMPPNGQTPHGREARSLGSGVIYNTDGVILTNSHVVLGADEIRVKLSDGREFQAEVVGTDPKSDIGVIRLKDKVEGLKPLPVGASAKLRLGETVIAIGNPFGVGQTVTMGIVSALGRANVGIADYEDFIQTDAAINPGNSGGALINLKGQLIGINTAIVSRTGGYQGIGFAIPSDMVTAIADSLITHGKVLRGWLGVMIQDIDSDMADALGLDNLGGVLVADVSPESPAEDAGVKRGDIIVEVDGTQVGSTGQLRNLIAGSGVGTKVKLTVLRDEKRKTVKVLLGELPEDLAEGQSPDGSATASALAGMQVTELNKDSRLRFEIPEDLEEGILIADLEFGSAAAEAGLRPGDVILEVDRVKVTAVDGLVEALGSNKNGRSLLLVWRGGGTSFVVLKHPEPESDKDKGSKEEPE